jgi:hypothetical protein
MERIYSLVLIGFCLVGLFFFNSCETEEEIVYDIRGTWAVTSEEFKSLNIQSPGAWVCSFHGSLTSGTWSNDRGYTGTYSVDGLVVQWEYDSGTPTYNGEFSSPTTMTGTFVGYEGSSGTWAASKHE